MKTLEETFGKPISVYTDEDACEDGGLVAINQHDRVTHAVWTWLESTTDMKNPMPPTCWPVDLMGFFTAKKPADRVLAMCRGVIDTNRRQAKRVYDENTNGGILCLWVSHEGGYGGRPTGLETREVGGQMKLWFIPNENDGITMMFPDDY
jgi:hypothetical protein